MEPHCFRTSAEFRKWLARNHASKAELLVRFHTRNSGKARMTWEESVDEALCFGWIDGVRKHIDAVSYSIRFTPRKPGGIWSGVNLGRAQALIEQDRMQSAGLQAYHARKGARTRRYSYEQRGVELAAPYRTTFERHTAAWKFFQAQPASYRKKVCWWIVGAKRQETRERRLAQVIDCSSAGSRLPQFVSRKRV